MAAWIFVVALSVRLVHLWQMRTAPVFSVLMGDARSYDSWAQRIAAGDWLGSDVFYQAPLYPYFLGVIYTAFGHDLMTVRIVQAAVGASACTLLALAATRLFGRGAGVVAGLGLALYAPAIFFDALIQKTVLDVFLVCLVLWICSRLIDTAGSPRAWLCLGLALGGLVLTRENAIVLAAVVLAWIALRRNQTRRGRAALALAGGLALVLAPVAARNYAVSGGLYLTTSQFGPNFYIGNNARADGTYMSLRPGRGAPEYERQDATELAERAIGRTLTPSEVSSYWTSRAGAFITSQPRAWAALVGRKLFLLVNAGEMLDTESQQTHAESSFPLRAGGWFGHFGVLVPLAILGVAATWSDRRRLWLFHALTIAYAASVVVFYVFARYRFPLVPLLMLFASAAIAGLPSLVRSSSRARRTGLAAAVAVAAIVANWPALSTATLRAVTENNLAVALQEGGRLDEAIAHYRRAAEIRADYAPAHNNMGTALRAKGQVDEAVASYRRAIQVTPDYREAHYNLGRALAEKGELSEAAQELRVAVALEPGSAAAHHNLGNVLASQGRPAEALEHLRHAVEIEPRNASAGYDLGTLLLEAGQIDGAAAALRSAIAARPDYAEAHNNLGIALGSQGKLAEAIEHFQQAVLIRPDYQDAQRNLDMARKVRLKPDP